MCTLQYCFELTLFDQLKQLFFICGQRTGIAAGGEFIERPARHKCPFENMLLKLRTKAEH